MARRSNAAGSTGVEVAAPGRVGIESAAHVTLLTRPAPSPDRKWITGDDVLKTLALPFWATVAWCMPERGWDDICVFMARIKRLMGGGQSSLAGKITAIVPDGVDGTTAAVIAERLEAGRYEHYFQILRDYRPGGWRPQLELIGREHIEQAQEKGVGAVLWVGHFVFNGLAPKLAFYQADIKVAHLSRPEHGFSKTRYGIHLLNPVRRHIEDRYLDKRILIRGKSGTSVMEQLRARVTGGGVVSITAGAWEGRRLALAPIFGGQFPLATGAVSLAISTGAPLLPLMVVRDERTGVVKVVVEAPIGLPPEVDKEAAIGYAVREYASRLRPWVHRYPGQWRGWRYVTPPSDAPFTAAASRL